MSMPKGFIPIKDGWINISCINQEKCYYDKKINKVVIFDKFNNKYCIDKKAIKGKLEINYGE